MLTLIFMVLDGVGLIPSSYNFLGLIAMLIIDGTIIDAICKHIKRKGNTNE